MKILSKIRDLHDELYKLTLIFLSVLTIVYFLPRESTFKYEYQLNKPWYYDDLIAPYDIPVFPTQNEILTIQKEIKLNNYKDRQVLETLIYEATDKSLIEKIISKESILIKNLINEKFVVKSEEYYGIEIYWKNDKFIFEYKLFDEDQYQLLELKDYYYCIPVNINEILVFTDESSFYFINGNKEKSIKLNKIKNGNNVPVGIIDLDNKILIFDFYNRGNINIFLKNKNKVISKFN